MPLRFSFLSDQYLVMVLRKHVRDRLIRSLSPHLATAKWITLSLYRITYASKAKSVLTTVCVSLSLIWLQHTRMPTAAYNPSLFSSFEKAPRPSHASVWASNLTNGGYEPPLCIL